MAESRDLASLSDAVRALLAWTQAAEVPVLIIGGVAVSLLSRPRTTLDVDASVWLPDAKRWSSFLSSAIQHAIEPRIHDALEFAQSSRVLLLVHRPSGVPIDVSLAALPFEENAIRSAVETTIGDMRVPLPTVEDLIIMKAIAQRPKDALDIAALVEANPQIDVARVTAVVREFAEALELPSLLDELVRLLPSQKKARARPRAKAAPTAKRRKSKSRKT